MNPKILIVIKGGQIVDCISNGAVEVYVEQPDNLPSTNRIEVREVTNEQFDAQLNQ